MSRVVSIPASVARSSTDRCVGQSKADDKPTRSNDRCVAPPENWFPKTIQRLLGTHKPGTALDCITNFVFGERNCQRYAAGDVRPPVDVLWVALRSNHGGPILDDIMQGSDAEWWREVCRARRIAAQVDSLDLH